ncbi:MAG: branched-chain amino acid transport system ATP-binding protein [Actinomycetota bacterium]|jgi:branched-chain amino acid transport system ATP-binding protein
MSALLEVEGLRAGYGPVAVLHGLDFSVPEGEIVVLLGANGAGKTTTLRALSGMIPATGNVRMGGKNILGLTADRVCSLGIAHVPQGRGTFNELTVEENLDAGAYLRKDKAEVKRDIASWCEEFPVLGERLKQHAGSLSGGEQQMLAVARALMSRPRLLLLDEPSLGLAPLVTRALFERLTEFNRSSGTTMLVVEQNANLALAIAQNAYVLEAGSIALSGPAADLAADDSVRRAYLGF